MHVTSPIPLHAKENHASNADRIHLHAVALYFWGPVCQAVCVQFSFASFCFPVLLSTLKGFRTLGSQPQSMSDSKLGSIY